MTEEDRQVFYLLCDQIRLASIVHLATYDYQARGSVQPYMDNPDSREAWMQRCRNARKMLDAAQAAMEGR